MRLCLRSYAARCRGAGILIASSEPPIAAAMARDGPLYLPMGILVTRAQRDRLPLSPASRRQRIKTPAYAPVDNEEWYATSTRVRWPRAWSETEKSLESAGVATAVGARGLETLRLMRLRQKRRDDREVLEAESNMDAIVCIGAGTAAALPRPRLSRAQSWRAS